MTQPTVPEIPAGRLSQLRNRVKLFPSGEALIDSSIGRCSDIEAHLMATRIVQFTAELADARAEIQSDRSLQVADLTIINTLWEQIERLSGPVSVHEFKEYAHHDDWGVDCVYLSACNDLLAARAKGGK